jgi:hypothetical protein
MGKKERGFDYEQGGFSNTQRMPLNLNGTNFKTGRIQTD